MIEQRRSASPISLLPVGILSNTSFQVAQPVSNCAAVPDMRRAGGEIAQAGSHPGLSEKCPAYTKTLGRVAFLEQLVLEAIRVSIFALRRTSFNLTHRLAGICEALAAPVGLVCTPVLGSRVVGDGARRSGNG